ncbi:hypothetical protein IAT40_004117 [Kwoniella sp. CBS 6097]
MPNSEETAHPGAGTLYVYGNGNRSRPTSRSGLGRKGKESREASPMPGSFARWDEIVKHHEDPVSVATTDSLLRHGIAEYTYIPQASGGVLGRGKFSTVYKVLGADGIHYALKHTPLYPHHPLISARLLREPTLLAELPSHPCLIGVEGWVRTEGHFYLIEQYAASHIPLSSITTPIQPSRAAYILDQLVSVIRDTLHEKGRVCHRDLKGENVLVDADTGEILILDLGLATRFSASEPKLTTCCGSPAFHSPEIVLALARPPGEVTYYGPELDIWCIALTLLSLLLQVRFPLGPKHTSTHVMRQRVLDRIQELDELYPPHAPWRPPRRSYQDDDTTDYEFEKQEWTRVRRALRDFLEIDGRKRMEKFKAYVIGDKVQKRVEDWEIGQEEKRFKSVTFIPAETKYTLPIYLDDGERDDNDEHQHQHDHHTKHSKKSGRRDRLVMFNPANESERRIKSYIKYLLRSAGILYHLLPTVNDPSIPGTPTTTAPSLSMPTEETIFQLVVPVSESATAVQPPSDPQLGWFPSLFSFGRKPPAPSPSADPAPIQTRSVSLPPSKRAGQEADSPDSPIATTANATASKEKSPTPTKMLRCYIKLEFVHPPQGQYSPTSNVNVDWRRRGSVETFTSFRGGWENGGSTALRQVTSNGSVTGGFSSRGANDITAGAGAIRAKNYTFPPPPLRSASVSRPNNTQRPMNRRSVSHAPSVQASRPQLNRILTTEQTNAASGHNAGLPEAQPLNHNHNHHNNALNHALTMSPLIRQVSLPPSPTHPDSDGPAVPVSRPPSRASSRSRMPSVTSGLNTSPQHTFSPIQHTWSHHSNQFRQDAAAGGQIIIHLSDPRSYAAIKKALSVKPASPPTNYLRNGGGGNDYRRSSTDMSLLSPMTVRRPSLAPSLSMSAHAHGRQNGARTSDSEQDQEQEQEQERENQSSGEEKDSKSKSKNAFNRKSSGLGIVSGHRGDIDIEQTFRRRHAEEEEEERGRPRSKEDTSSMLLHLQKVKSRNSAKSASSKSSKLLYPNQTSTSEDGESESEAAASKNIPEGAQEHAKAKAKVKAKADGVTHVTDLELKAEIKQPLLLPTALPSEQKQKEGSRSRSREKSKSRGLFEVLFGHSHGVVVPTSQSAANSHGHHNHNENDNEGNTSTMERATERSKDGNAKPRTHVKEPGYGGHNGSRSGGASAGSSGYGRAARARSVPPYMNVNELVQHHHF